MALIHHDSGRGLTTIILPLPFIFFRVTEQKVSTMISAFWPKA